MEVISFEAHDVELGMEALESGFGIDNLLVECRSGESWAMPGNPNQASANGVSKMSHVVVFLLYLVNLLTMQTLFIHLY